MPPDPLETDLETDDRFPSGPWMGFYVQWGQRGRQDLNLTFRDSLVTGVGRDGGGDFAVRGTYDVENGAVRLRKTYPEHAVEYDGAAQSHGIIGNWEIRGVGYTDRGQFHIWPIALGESEGVEIEEEAPVGV